MLAPRGSPTPVTPLFIEGLLDPKGPLVLQVILVKMALMVDLEEWAYVALQASQDFEGKMDHPAPQDAQRREMMEMMDSLVCLVALDPGAAEDHQAFQE